MFDALNVAKSTKYDILIKWLKAKLENNENIKEEDLELLLFSFGIEIKHNVQILGKGEK